MQLKVRRCPERLVTPITCIATIATPCARALAGSSEQLAQASFKPQVRRQDGNLTNSYSGNVSVGSAAPAQVSRTDSQHSPRASCTGRLRHLWRSAMFRLPDSLATFVMHAACMVLCTHCIGHSGECLCMLALLHHVPCSDGLGLQPASLC